MEGIELFLNFAEKVSVLGVLHACSETVSMVDIITRIEEHREPAVLNFPRCLNLVGGAGGL